jgi:hypothetical protein
VALSCLAISARPGTDRRDRGFYLVPSEAECLPICDYADRLTDYQIFYWHALEMEARSRKYAEILIRHGGRVARIRTEDLENQQSICALVEALGLDSGRLNLQKLQPLLGARANGKTRKKRAVTISGADLEKQEAEVQALLACHTSMAGRSAAQLTRHEIDNQVQCWRAARPAVELQRDV